MLLTYRIVIDEEGKKVRENAKNSLKGECCCRRGGKYWDVIYGYKYWRSLEPGKRIVEFAGSGSSEGTVCFLFSFYHPSCFRHLPALRSRSARFPTISQTRVYFIRRTDWSTCLRVAQKVFLRDFSGKESGIRRKKKRTQMMIEFASALQHSARFRAIISAERRCVR